MFIFSFGKGDGESEWAVDSCDMATVSVGGFYEVFVLFKVDGIVLNEFGPELKAGEVLEVEEDGGVGHGYSSSASFSRSQSLLARDLVSVSSFLNFSMAFLSPGIVLVNFFVNLIRLR